MSTIVSYDVKTNHSAFKANLRKQGFYDCITMNDNSRRLLPNTTVMYESQDLDVVQGRFNAALSATTPNPGLEKVAYIPFTGGWRLISDASC